MKKVVLCTALLLSVATFAQKDELKTLKKIYAKEIISEKDLEAYKSASTALDGLATEESDKVYAKFYKTMYPTVVLASKGVKATMQDQMKLYNPEFIKEYGAVIDETIEFEKKSGKKLYTDELLQEKKEFKANLTKFALGLNNSSNFKEASTVFYALYEFDKKNEGKSLLNSAILALQSKNYTLAEKLYEEFYSSDYFNKGVMYFAVNKANGKEEDLGSREERMKYINLGLYEKPKDIKVYDNRAEILRTLSILYAQNNSDKIKLEKILTEARLLLPNDEDLLLTEYNLYFNQGYELIKDDLKLVDEINSSVSNKKKYDELVKNRKNIFTKATPFFEKAYSIKPNDVNVKNVLKISYEIIGQLEKAKFLK